MKKKIEKIFCPTTVPVLAHFDQHFFCLKHPQNMHIFKNWKKIRLCQKKSKKSSFWLIFCPFLPKNPPEKLVFQKFENVTLLS